MRHGPVRVWFTPWKRRCRCGCLWFPCPDAATVEAPPPAQSLRGRAGNDPFWDAPTRYYPRSHRNERPFMTPGQEWRSRSGRP